MIKKNQVIEIDRMEFPVIELIHLIHQQDTLGTVVFR